MALTWYIDQKDIATEYGCSVEGSSGLLDMPKAKSPLSADIDDWHGEMMDMEDIRYQPRDIILSCFLIGTSMGDFNTKINNFKVSLAADGPHQLTITGLAIPVSYIIMCTDGFTVSKQWRANGMTIGTFQLKLREMCPVKCVLKYVGAGTMGLDVIPFLDISGRIYWGDGYYSTPADVDGLSAYTHTYSAVGTYYIVITGALNPNITPDYGSATLLWEQLL